MLNFVRRFKSLFQAAYYWLEFVLLAGMFFMRGAAPPPSRKLTERPTEPPVFVDARPPLKYGRRLTAVPLIVPGARIPGTAFMFGVVSVNSQQEFDATAWRGTYSYQ
jgi:hypothetical protein